MPQTEIPYYKRVDNTASDAQKTNKQKSETHTRLKKTDYISGAISFLLARTSMLGALNPFCMAFFSTSYTKARMPLTMLCSLIGSLSAGAGTYAFKYLIAMGVFSLYKIFFDKKGSALPLTNAIAVSISLFLGGITLMLFDMMLAYNIALLVLECIICGFLVILFGESNIFFQNKAPSKNRATNEQLLSLMLIFSLSLAGISNITKMGTINLVHIIYGICVIFLAYCRGIAIGTCAGTCVGMLCSLNSLDMLSVIGIYTLCGFFAGCAKPLGKYGICLSFATCALSLGFMTTMYAYGEVGILNFLISVVIFAFFPQKKLEYAASFVNGYYGSRSDMPYIARMQEMMNFRLYELEDTFKTLADSFDELSVRRSADAENIITNVFDSASEKICMHCGLRGHCWDKESDLTLSAISAIKKKLSEKGYADILDTPALFREKCVKCEEFVAACNHFYEINRINTLWEGQAQESRKVLSQQYRGFASVVNSLCAEINNDIICESKYEKKITSELLKHRISVKSLCVFERIDGCFEVEVEFFDADDFETTNEIEDIISQVLGIPMCMTHTLTDELRVIYEPVLNYKIESGVATLKKDGQNVNGDSYCSVALSSNKYLVAISDGMGCGENAACESKTTINLLKKLLIAGFDKISALQLINSALVSKSGTESFATIDLALIDMVNAGAEFVKVGASTGYIKHAESIESIFCNTLPAGILTEADISLSKKRLTPGDYIVILSDGIANARKNTSWICETLMEINENEQAETIAEIILKEAVIHKRGKVDDDMTVVVAKILEK